MAQNCYDIFKSTYNQAVADGFATAVATAAAQSAMDDCLGKQATQVQAVAPIVTVPGSVPPDPGPTSGGNLNDGTRGSSLGVRRNQQRKGN